tara:strand:- start:225 stop:683 length:459 start_codon:yes stop_codon:yes gene_type:complete
LTTFFKISSIKRKILFLLVLITNSCEKNKIERNPYLNNVRINYEINLNLPEFDALRYIGGSKKILNIGLNGVIVFNLNNTSYLAWEASCSNHNLKDCSKLKIEGVLAKCNCENYQYSLATGQLINPEKNLKNPFGLLFYQTNLYNNILRISN